MTDAVEPETSKPVKAAPLRIQRISLTDFRAFPGPAPVVFDLHGKNLLVYGENGSGKSSLFHALQDFFTLELKRSLAAHKNVFSDAADDQCRVVVEFMGQESDPAEWTVKRHPCTYDFKKPVTGYYDYFFRGADSRALDVARRSAFLDYKALLDTNYKHGTDEINLFEVAVNSLLRDCRVTVSGGTESTLGVLWQQVIDAEKAAKSAKPAANALTKINQACVEFNSAFRQAIDRLLPDVNRILVSLGWYEVVLTALQTPGLTYKNARLRRDRLIEGQRLSPVLTFRGHPLERPQLFLNEARLSGLALALYLGGRLACTPSGDSTSLKLMVLDDVLIGLDHSNRLPVLDLLNDLFKDWQIVLLTHDRGWFDLARQRLPGSYWVCYEVYEGDAAAVAPMPIVRKSHDHPPMALLKKAQDLLALGYLEAASNYVRQAFETGVRAACEFKSIKLPYKQDVTNHKAQVLLDGLKGWTGSDVVPKADWDTALHRLEVMKDVVMNPYSHPNAPNIPRQEIVQAAEAVGKLLELVRKKK